MDSFTIISPDEVRTWCRIDDDADDVILQLLIDGAVAEAAAHTGLDLWDDCPGNVRSAILIRVATLYANREGEKVPTRTFHDLLGPSRKVSL